MIYKNVINGVNQTDPTADTAIQLKLQCLGISQQVLVCFFVLGVFSKSSSSHCCFDFKLSFRFSLYIITHN